MTFNQTLKHSNSNLILWTYTLIYRILPSNDTYPNIAQLAELPTVESLIRRDRAVPGSNPGVRIFLLH